MPETVFFVSAFALLIGAAAVLLWQWADRRMARDESRQFLSRQISTHGTGGGMADPSPVPSGTGAPRALVDPWAPAVPDVGASARQAGRFQIALPDSLRGVVSPRTLGLGLAAFATGSLLAMAVAGALAGVTLMTLQVLGGVLVLWLRLQKRRRRLVAQLPGFIDAMVRLISVGNATQAAFQLCAASTATPLRDVMEDAAGLMRAGVDLDAALHQSARATGIEEMSLLAAIMGVGVRYGGRTDLLLERVATFMRDRELAGQELVAMSAETRLSAWILGLMPLVVAGMIVMTNGSYFMRMWHDPTGQTMIFGAAALQLAGAFLLYRLARIA